MSNKDCPNIFDIFLDSILEPLKHKEQKSKLSPQKPTIPSQSSSQQYFSTNLQQPPQTTPAQKPTPRNDDFNFLEWLLFPNHPQRKIHKTPPKLIEDHEFETQKQIEQRIIKNFLDFFEEKMNKDEFNNFKKIFSLGLSFETRSSFINQDNIKIENDEIMKFLFYVDKFESDFNSEFNETAGKSINGLKIYTTEKNRILTDFYKNLEKSVYLDDDKLRIFQGLLNPNIEDHFFWQNFSKTYVGDCYKTGKPMVLERSEELLKFYVESLKIKSINNPNHELISSFLDSQQERGIKVLQEKFDYYDPNSQMQSRSCLISSNKAPHKILVPRRAERCSSSDRSNTVVC